MIEYAGILPARDLHLLRMKYNFDTFPARADTGSLKWDKYRGRDILPLWVADLDFLSAPEVIEALQRRLDHGIYGYTIPHEEPESAVLDYLRESHGLAVEKEWLVWLPGMVPALNLAARGFCQKGGAVTTCTPVYPPFLSAPKNAGVPLNTVPLVCKNGRWTFDFEAMEKSVPQQGGIFFLCSPHNPVGQCFTREELLRVIEFCRHHKLVLCSDEIHCDLILEENIRHIPTLSLTDPEKDLAFAMYAPSKTYNLPGLACAFAVIPHPEVRRTFKNTIQGIITEINVFGYAGCAAAYRYGEPWRKELLQVLRTNRDMVYQFIQKQYPEIVLHPMEATYLAWLDCRKMGHKNPTQYFEDKGVGLSDGAFFGNPGWVRLNFGCPSSFLHKALARLA